jgi:MYXO-CTERM domain-containing protein
VQDGDHATGSPMTDPVTLLAFLVALALAVLISRRAGPR